MRLASDRTFPMDKGFTSQKIILHNKRLHQAKHFQWNLNSNGLVINSPEPVSLSYSHRFVYTKAEISDLIFQLAIITQPPLFATVFVSQAQLIFQ